jgi:hypothetical protein
VLAAVEEMDLGAFYRPYSSDGVGRPAHDPQMMVAATFAVTGAASITVVACDCV